MLVRLLYNKFILTSNTIGQLSYCLLLPLKELSVRTAEIRIQVDSANDSDQKRQTYINTDE